MNKINHLEILLFLKQMPKKFRAVIKTLCDFQMDVLRGTKKSVFPTRLLIAKISKCSESTVKQCVKKCHDFGFIIRTERLKENKRNKSNLYETNINLLEVVHILEMLSIYHKLDEHIDELIEETSQDEGYLVSRYFKRNRVFNKQLPAEILYEMPAISSYLKNPENKRHITLRVHQAKGQKEREKKSKDREKDLGRLGETRISHKKGLYLKRYRSYAAILYALAAYWKCENREGVKDPDAFLWAVATWYDRQQLKLAA